MCDTWIGATFVTFFTDPHPPPWVALARVARREGNAKKIPSAVHFVSDVHSVT